MSCIRTIGRLVSEFARLILFVASIFFLLISLLLLAFTYQSRRDFAFAKVEEINTGLTILVGLSIYLIVLAVLGVFASFFSSKSTIKLLACMLILNVIIGIGVLVTSTPKFENAQGELETKFKEYLGKYNWSHEKESSSEVKKATQAWDNLQTDSHCCGLNSPHDWDQFRPKNLAANMFPLSCCQRNDMIDPEAFDNGNITNLYCDRKTEKFWSKGCSKEMEGAMAAILYLMVGLIGFNLILGLLSLLVICCRPNSMHYDSY